MLPTIGAVMTEKNVKSSANNDLAAHLADRDVSCPFCQANLRGTAANACPKCGKEITLGLLKNTKQAGADLAIWAVRFLSLIAMSIAGYLAYNAIANAQPAGCGPTGGCGEVLSSRWSKLFGVPVSIPAMLIYAGIIVGTFFITPGKRDTTRRDGWLVLITLALFAGLGAIWFIGLQLFVIKAVCPYCMADHACGLIAAGILLVRAPLSKSNATLKPPRATFAMVMTVAVFTAFVALQVRYSKLEPGFDDGSKVVTTDGNGPGLKDHIDKDKARKDRAGKDSAGKDGSTIPPGFVAIKSIKDPSEIDPKTETWLKLRSGPAPDGYVALPRREFPVLGTYDAEHLFVALVDYTCPHCRDLHAHLHAMHKRYGEQQISFLLVPMPLDSKCNFNVRETHPRHKDACALAKTALIVFRAAPEKFPAFDDWLFSGPNGARTEIEALKQAVEVLGADRYKEVAKDPWVDQQIQRDVTLYSLSNTSTDRRIPRLLYKGITISGPADAATLFRLLEDNVGLKPVK